MRKQHLNLQGFAYKQGDKVEVFLKLASGKYVRCLGDVREAKLSFGRDTRLPSRLGRPDMPMQ